MPEGLNTAFALFGGLLMAAAMQLLLTNLGIALGLTVLDLSAQEDPAEPAPDGAGLPLSLTHWVGLGVAVSLALVLFVAALLMTEFSQISDPRQGAILGCILWATYWLLLVWFSATTLAGWVGALWETTIASGRQFMAALRQMLHPQRSPQALAGQSHIHDLAVAVSQMRDLQRQLPALLAQQRETLIQDITQRTDLSQTEAASVVAEIEPEPARADLSPADHSSLLAQLNLPSWQQLVRQLLDQVDFSHLDVETLWQQLQAFRQEPAAPELTDSDATIRVDAEDFIGQAPVWSLKPEVLEEEFYQRLYDPDAAPELIRQQLEHLHPDQFREWLHRRGDLAAEQVDTVTGHLSQIYQSVQDRVAAQPASTYPPPAGQELEKNWHEFEEKLTAYCRYTNLDLLTADSLTKKVHGLRQELALPASPLATPHPPLDVAEMVDILSRRQGISATQKATLAAALHHSLDAEAEQGGADEAWLTQVRQRLQSYLNTVDWSTISLEDVKPEVQHQLQWLDLRGDLDWQALGSQLQIPDDIKADLLDWLQTTGRQLSHRPRRWATRVGQSTQTFARYLTRQITHYFQFQDKEAFQPEQMAKDLTQILKGALAVLPDPSEWGQVADLRSWVEESSLQAILENRRDMTADHIQQVLGWFDDTWQTLTQQALHWGQTLWAEAQSLLSAPTDNLDALRQQLVEGIVDAQQALQSQARQVKAELQNQADAARKQVAIALWWLFFSLLASAGTAMAAGWLAAQY